MALTPQEYLQSLDQAKSARKREKYANLFELSSDLSNGKFVKNISIYPSLQVTLVHPDMTREFENICKILYSERCPGMTELKRFVPGGVVGTNFFGSKLIKEGLKTLFLQST